MNRTYCEKSTINKFNQIECKADNQPCAFQRYCANDNKWYNSENYSTCRGRDNMIDFKEKKDNIEKIETPIFKDKLEDLEVKVEGEVIDITPFYIIIKDKDGNGIRKNGSFTDFKLGDIVTV